MATVDRTQSAANERLVARMRAWAAVEDRYEPVSDEVVARQLPELLELAEAFPAQGRRPLLFPPIGGGPAAGRR
jgi:hypothetical protein